VRIARLQDAGGLLPPSCQQSTGLENACSYQVKVGNGGRGSPPVGYEFVAASSTNAKGDSVQTHNLNGALVDEPFHLAVHC
jgi:hypothetical protein